jgi:hypothetical protein
VASAVADTGRLRDATRWWERRPARREALEGVGLLEDRTITRLSPEGIDGNLDLRATSSALGVEPRDLLTYLAYAEGGFGRYRLAAIFPLPPDAMEPLVLCLDGPRGLAASEHRFDDVRLCLYFKNDPPERRWKPEDGVRRLFDLARRHVTGEYLARELPRGKFRWAVSGFRARNDGVRDDHGPARD